MECRSEKRWGMRVFSIYLVENAGNFIEVLWEGLERSNAQAREAPLAELLDPRQN